ncbi:MAG: aspartyl/asparaginyl beta-hydroxylase domain-containing protein [Arenimonas sp.]|uniref:aspartyl/asparaginyl beta-hydroxylase domain-containing protein n=1 Tax=Arenimonas sp. TaxID=1872635 RepID=UPI0025C417C8|nr:aspartyl/asparaginyl beta-hydroxylase domain-containing protein [Arenimonas sp.]MBW8368535.1 aspartyl/asparaginyl beta-hydroxylase domain-containing protein [Arenimonas sp.]
MNTNAAATDPRIAALAVEAEGLARRGQTQASARLWDQVLALAPEHAGALTFLGTLALAGGDTAQAASLLQRAVRGSPPMAMAHAQLARVYRATRDDAAALQELDRALKLEPSAYGVHFEKAAIYGQLGREKDQALAFASALQVMPAQAAMTPELQPLVARAQRMVTENQAQLGEFLDRHLAELRGSRPGRTLERFEESLDVSLGRRPLQLSQPGMFNVVGLPSIAFFDRADFAWAPAAEACTDKVRAELQDVLQQDAEGFIPYVQTRPGEPVGQFQPLDFNPDWSAYFLWRHGKRVESHIARCPETMAMLDAVPQVAVQHRAPAAFFSALKPHTRIPAHNGATNCRLTVHLPLIIPPNCGLRVGNHVRPWTPGELLIFDDTVEHAAWNDSDQLRVVLIFDIWHPLLSADERRLVQGALEGIMAYYGRDAPLGEL